MNTEVRIKSPATGKSVTRVYSDQELIQIYLALLFPRIVEERMLLLLRQGGITKWFSGIGQEAISVGTTLALESDEFVLPLHRNLGVFTTRGVPLKSLFCQFRGTRSGFTQGRDRSFHFGIPDFHILGMISHLGPQMAVADGVALASRLRKEKKIAVTFCGDGGTSEGDFHEALNVAAVWDLPVLFVVENNGYGLSTPVSEQFRCKRLSDRAKGYGIKGYTIDGNDILEVYQVTSELVRMMRTSPQPVLLECNTFRIRGHEEASGVKYVPPELISEWQKRDPVAHFEGFLLRKGILSKKRIETIRSETLARIETELEEALLDEPVSVDSEHELSDVFYPSQLPEIQLSSSEKKEMRFVDAISDGLRLGLRRHKNLILMGQDISDYGGVFKVTEGFIEEFGRDRLRNTPLCESAIIGAGVGLSAKGYKSVIEMQFADFVSSGFTQVVNNLAKTHYRWGGTSDVVIRLPCGAGVSAGPFHSQTMEAWFFHTPGLKIAYPAFPEDAKGMLLAAIEDPNPVLFFEHKKLYRSLKGLVPEGLYFTPLGRARTLQEGSDASIITYGAGVHWALEVVKDFPDISIEIVDLRSLCPLDWQAVSDTVQKTNRVLVLHEANLTGGVGGELSAFISEECFESLDAPIVRVGSLDTPVPFTGLLEENYLARNFLRSKLEFLLEY